MENQRVRITKKMLTDSLIHLLSEKNIHKISVREICDHAQINRTTFYKHYKDPHDLLLEIETNVLSLLNQHLTIHSLENDDLLKILNFVHENIELVKILLSQRTGSDFLKKMLSTTNIHQLIHYRLSPTYNEKEISYISDFLIHGGTSIIKNWIYQEKRETPTEIKTLIETLITKILPPPTN